MVYDLPPSPANCALRAAMLNTDDGSGIAKLSEHGYRVAFSYPGEGTVHLDSTAAGLSLPQPEPSTHAWPGPVGSVLATATDQRRALSLCRRLERVLLPRERLSILAFYKATPERLVFLAERQGPSGSRRRVFVKWVGVEDRDRLRKENACLHAIAKFDPNRVAHVVAFDDRMGVLLTEPIDGDELSSAELQVGEARHWMLQAVAALHASAVQPQDLGKNLRRFPWSLDVWLQHQDVVRARTDAPTRARLWGLYQDLVAALDRVDARGSDGPVRTLVHGDLHPANIKVDWAAGRVILMDFEFASVTDPMFDLGFFMAGQKLPSTTASAWLHAYHAAAQLPPRASDLPRLWLNLAYMRLFRLVASYAEYDPAAPQASTHAHHLALLRDDLALLQAHGLLDAGRHSLSRLDGLAAPESR